MIAQTAVTVKMENGASQASVSDQGVVIEDMRAYSPRMITMMNLEDAILVARAILSFAEDAEIDRMAEEMEDARWDAMSAHFDFD